MASYTIQKQQHARSHDITYKASKSSEITHLTVTINKTRTFLEECIIPNEQAQNDGLSVSNNLNLTLTPAPAPAPN